MQNNHDQEQSNMKTSCVSPASHFEKRIKEDKESREAKKAEILYHLSRAADVILFNATETLNTDKRETLEQLLIELHRTKEKQLS